MKVMKVGFIALIVAGSVGCMSNTKPAGKAMSFECSGAGHGWDECSAQADKACGASNYSVVSRDEKSDTGASGNSEMKRKLNVVCK